MSGAVQRTALSVSSLALAVFYASTLLTQQPPPAVTNGSPQASDTTPASRGRFQSESTLVVVDAIVSDKKGHPVNDLSAADFKVYEDGVLQQVTTFAPPEAVQAPSTQSTSANAAAAPASAVPADLPRFLTVVLDLADNSPSSLKESCETVLKYLEKAGSGQTLIAIYYVDRGLHLALPFTNDHKAAQEAIAKLQRRVSRGALTAADRKSVQQEINDLYERANPSAASGAVPGGAGGGRGNPFAGAYMREIDTLRSYLDVQNVFQTRDTWIALRSIATSYQDLPGRKNVVLFSEGFPWSDETLRDLDAVVPAAAAANVSFYVIDPSGLGTAPVPPCFLWMI
jgi:VWFA-related protein